jgi:hypothetical protein
MRNSPVRFHPYFKFTFGRVIGILSPTGQIETSVGADPVCLPAHWAHTQVRPYQSHVTSLKRIRCVLTNGNRIVRGGHVGQAFQPAGHQAYQMAGWKACPTKISTIPYLCHFEGYSQNPSLLRNDRLLFFDCQVALSAEQICKLFSRVQFLEVES